MNKILKRYTDPSKPGSFLGLSGFKRNTKNKNSKAIESSLLKLNAYTLHKNKRKIFKRCKVRVTGIDDQWQVDLLDTRDIKGSNFGVSYIFTCIDVFSKKGWAKAIKNKGAPRCKKVFEQIIIESKRKPNHVYLDSGNEFKGEFSKYCKDQNIQIFPSTTKLKASVVERFNRTLKEKMWRMFTYHSSIKSQKPKNFTNYLEKLVKSYNKSFHRSIQMAPTDVNKQNESKVREVLYSDQDTIINFKYKIGDYIRISAQKNLFSKGYTPNWSDDIYIISNLIPSTPPRYIIKDLENIVYEYKFYTEELQKVLYEEFPYDAFKIIEENPENFRVEKINSNQEKVWLSRAKISNYTRI